MDVLHRYHDWNDAWPTAEEQAYATEGRTLFEGWESRMFGGTNLSPQARAGFVAAGEDPYLNQPHK